MQGSVAFLRFLSFHIISLFLSGETQTIVVLI